MSWSKRFIPELKARGYEIEMIFFTEGDLDQCKFIKFFKALDIKIHHYPHQSFSYFKIRWILNILKQNKTDIFISNDFVHAFYASKWIKQAGIPTIGILHSDDEFHYGVIEEFVNGKEEYRLSAVVSVSKLLQQKIESLSIKNIKSVYIPYGAPVDKVKTDFSGSKTKLLYIGRLSEWQKRITETTHALCQAVKEIDNIEVMLYGGGDVDTVKSIIRTYGVGDKVKLGGLLPSDQVQDAMIQYDVFVLLSDFEGLPIALMEAMACGLVPVCKNIESGIPELIDDKVHGLLVNDRGKEFVEAIRSLHENRELMKTLSQNARAKIIAGYSSEYSVKIWDAFLQDLHKNNLHKAPLKVPSLFSLPKRNPKLIREDIRLLYVKDNMNRFILMPLFYKIKDALKKVIIKLGLAPYFLKVY